MLIELYRTVAVIFLYACLEVAHGDLERAVNLALDNGFGLFLQFQKSEATVSEATLCYGRGLLIAEVSIIVELGLQGMQAQELGLPDPRAQAH